MSINLNCFKAYDIRGVLGDELNEEIAYRIGRAFSDYTQAKSVVVGGDVRLSSEALKLALARGLQDSGTDVIDIGMVGTEEIYFATSHLGLDGGIEVTASHNPMNYNGMKLVKENSKPISGDTGLDAIKEMVGSNNFKEINLASRGMYKQLSIIDAYVDKLISYVDLSKFTRPLKLVINSGNGAAGHVIDSLEKRFNESKLPIEVIKIHHEPNGHFPNGIPNPLLPECRKDTSQAVLEHKADMGIAFDGDFDRCFFFDENGRFIEGYYIVGLLAEAFLKKNANSKIIHDPRLSWNTIDIVTSSGGIPVVSKTGHAFIKERMREEDAIYGGEMSAHHYFRDFYYCDSGMIPWLLVTELLTLRDSKLSELVNDRMELFPASGEINSIIKNPKEAIAEVLKRYSSYAVNIDHIDGISMTFSEWRFNLRSSNTEPVVRLNVEARANSKILTEKTNEILAILRSND